MHIEIKNFGPIQKFSYGLDNDFLLIVGENNIGKSYAISVIYNILKTLLTANRPYYYYYDYLHREVDDVQRWLKETERQVSTGSSKEIDISNIVIKHIELVLERTYIPVLRESLYGTFSDISNLKNRYSDEPMEITISGDVLSISITVENGKLKLNKVELYRKSVVIRKIIRNRTNKDYGDRVVVYFPEENPDRFERNYIDLILGISLSLSDEASSKISDIHYLPASRSGLYQALSAFGQIVAELAKNRTMLTKKIELPGISEPLSDYFLKLSEARPVAQNDVSNPYFLVAKMIEDEILLGTVDIDTKTKKIMFSQPEIGLKLDLSATSSMVSEISPIASYLKYVLPRSEMTGRRRYASEERKQILFVEEPEAHLHPKVQVALMRVFSRLVGTTNTRIIMTSHSNFIFSKLSNLIIDGSISKDRFRAILFKKISGGSYSEDLNVNQFGVADENFVDVAQSLYEERLVLIDSIAAEN